MVVVVVVVIMIVVMIMVMVMVVVVRMIDHDNTTLVAVPGLAITTIAMVAEATSHGQHVCGGDNEACDAGHVSPDHGASTGA